jgi:hypothetical protein
MTKANALALGGGLLVVVVVAVFLLRATDADKSLKLEMRSGNCAITTAPADKDVKVGNNKKITWSVQNLCNADQLVLVGNFRSTQNDPGNVMDCKAGVIETTWPFKKLDQSVRQVFVPAGETQALTLKEAKNNTGNTLTFYFDICMGGKKVDPRLDIDP